MSRMQQKDFDRDSREDIIVNHVHPGYVSTNMTQYQGHLKPEEGKQIPALRILGFKLSCVLNFFVTGAAAPSWLALLPPNIDAPKGAYIWHDKRVIDWVEGPMPSVV